MANKIRVAALALSFALVLTGADSCKGGKPPSDEPQPREDSGSCDIINRSYNSKGEEYVELDCNLDGAKDNLVVLPGTNAYPKCLVSAYWPACKTA